MLDVGLPDLPQAMCQKEDPQLFFGAHVCGPRCDGPQGCIEGKGEQGRYARIKSAKEVCMSCPEKHPCLEWALNTNQSYGIWGGRTERERKVIQKARQGRAHDDGDT